MSCLLSRVLRELLRRRQTTSSLPGWGGGAHFLEDLYWHVYAQEEYFEKDEERVARPPAKGKIIGDVVRPTDYRAPSWSWASIDGSLKFIPLSWSHLVAQMEDCYTKPASADKFGKCLMVNWTP